MCETICKERTLKKAKSTPVSHKKVKYVRRRKEENIDGFRLFDIQIFEDIVSSIVCPECYEKSLYVLGMNPFEVNVRGVYTSRSCGFGHTNLEKLCCVLNIPKTMTVSSYNSISNNVRDAVKLVAEKSMNNAVNELKKGPANILDMGVKVDGTWQSRG